MKILVACDYLIRPEMLVRLKELEQYGCELITFDNKNYNTVDKVMNAMKKTEVDGAESIDAGDEFIEAIKDVDILVVHITPVNRKVIEAAKKLKLVAVMRGGYENINVKLLKEKNIPVVNAPWRSSFAVADFTVGMMLAETRDIAKGHYYLKEGKWEKDYPNSSNVRDMRNRIIGIIGFGYIGQRVAQNLSGFGSKLLIHDPFIKNEVIESLGYKPVSLEKLLKESDIVSIHLRLSDKTKNFIGRKELAMLKPTATIINTARAGLIDQEALIEVLKEHKIMGAAIDVYNAEPLPEDSPYMELDNITITPHIAGVSTDTLQNSIEIILSDLHRYFRNEKLKCLVKA